jgi:hypothetical protein
MLLVAPLIDLDQHNLHGGGQGQGVGEKSKDAELRVVCDDA